MLYFPSVSEVGGVSSSLDRPPDRKTFCFVRVCDAKLRVPAGRCCSLRWAAGARKVLWSGPCPCLALAATRCPSMRMNAKQFLLFSVVSRCLLWLTVASRCFPLRCRCIPCAFKCNSLLVPLVPLAGLQDLMVLLPNPHGPAAVRLLDNS